MIPTPSATPLHENVPSRDRAPEFQPRDAEILRVFQDIRFAETRDLETILTPSPFPSGQKLRLRLPKLEALQMLARPARHIRERHSEHFEVLGEARQPGRPQDVWALAARGAAHLKITGDWNKNNRRLHPGAFTHPLMVTRVYVALRRAERRGLIDLDQWTPENAWRERVDVGGVRLPVVPDSVFVISDHKTDQEARVMLEVDNHTEPLTRRTYEQSSFLKKATGYWHFWDRAVRPVGMGMIVMVITKRPEWAEALRATAARVDPHERGLNLFWFSSEAEWSPTKPEDFLYKPIWHTAGGIHRPLFE